MSENSIKFNESAGTSAPDGAEFKLKAVYRSTGGIVTAVKAATVVDSNANANGTRGPPSSRSAAPTSRCGSPVTLVRPLNGGYTT
jgi:hypothetical protein